MASVAQIVANRLNARKSTGPRTGAGKAAVAQNAVRHGLLAQQTVIGGEDPGEFEFYRDQMLDELERLRLLRELEGNHRQATLDAATQAKSTPEPPFQTEDKPLRQTNPILRVLGQKTPVVQKTKPIAANSAGLVTGGAVRSRQIRNPRQTQESAWSKRTEDAKQSQLSVLLG